MQRVLYLVKLVLRSRDFIVQVKSLAACMATTVLVEILCWIVLFLAV
jgi:hypothetical protein